MSVPSVPLPRRMKFTFSSEGSEDWHSDRKKKDYRRRQSTLSPQSCTCLKDHELCIFLCNYGKNRARVIRPSGNIDVAIYHAPKWPFGFNKGEFVLAQVDDSNNQHSRHLFPRAEPELAYICGKRHWYHDCETTLRAVKTFMSTCRNDTSLKHLNLREESALPDISTWENDLQFGQRRYTKLSKTKYRNRAWKGLEIIATELRLLEFMQAYISNNETNEEHFYLPAIATTSYSACLVKEGFPLLSHLSAALMLDFYASLPRLNTLPPDVLHVIDSFLGEASPLNNACNELLYDRKDHYNITTIRGLEYLYYYPSAHKRNEVGSLKGREFLAEYANRVVSSWAQIQVKKHET